MLASLGAISFGVPEFSSVTGWHEKLYATGSKPVENSVHFRLIQSIPSKKAEPFKMWLAQVGKERIEEIENPEFAQDRVKEYYELKGYPKDWIDKRLRGIAIRQDLTEVLKNRNAIFGTPEMGSISQGMEIEGRPRRERFCNSYE